jgi:hypothetical protein
MEIFYILNYYRKESTPGGPLGHDIIMEYMVKKDGATKEFTSPILDPIKAEPNEGLRVISNKNLYYFVYECPWIFNNIALLGSKFKIDSSLRRYSMLSSLRRHIPIARPD